MSAAAAVQRETYRDGSIRVCADPDCIEPAGGDYGRFCDRHRAERRHKHLKWISTPEIDELIRQAYHRLRVDRDRQALKAVSRRIGWPKHAISRRAEKLGLCGTFQKPKAWSDAEVKILERYGWMCLRRIAMKLAASGFHRTPEAVHIKLTRMRIKSNSDWYSANQLADAFGVDNHKVAHWIRWSWLKAERRGTDRNERNGGDMWVIHHEDVRKFALAYPEVYDLAKVEKFWFLDLITKGAICR